MVGKATCDAIDAPAEAPTLAHVAALAGVSPATASRAINGTARVSPAARSQVEDAVRRLGYVRHRAPSAPGERGALPIAAVVCEDTSRVFSDPYFAALMWGIGRVLGDDTALAMLTARSARQWTDVENYLRAGHVAGALLINVHACQSLGLLAATARVPIVAAGRPLGGASLPYVDVDNEGGAYAAVDHLARRGRRVIATIAGPRDMAAGVDRLTGYRKAMADAGLPMAGLVGYGDFRRPSGEHAMNRLLDHRPDIDAVFVASDLMAAGALRALARAGRRVPDDVAVVGFDDGIVARRTVPALTTVRQPVEDMGARLARELLARIAGRAAGGGHVMLRTALVRRESS